MSNPELDVVLRADNLNKQFRARGAWRASSPPVAAVQDVSFEIRRGETVALVGESGSGKSTTARLLTLLERPDSGSVEVLGVDWTKLRGRQLRQQRRHLQLIFQDPYASLDPTKMVVHLIGEPLMIAERTRGAALDGAVRSLLELVGLPSTAAHRYPHEFSGGQRQRIAIARALAANPQVVIADEAVSALDVSTQAQILNLLKDIQDERGLAFLFITHDLGVVRQMADRVIVLYKGRVVEHGSADDVLERPAETYTKQLLAAVPEVSTVDREERRKLLVAPADQYSD